MAETENISHSGSAQNAEFIEQLVNKAVKEAVEQDRKEQAAKRAEAERNVNTIDLVELFYRLIENFKFVIIMAVIGAVVGGAYAKFFTTPIYSATSKLYVLSTEEQNVTTSDLTVGSQLSVDYTEVFKNWEVHSAVREALGLSYTNSQLSSMLTISIPSNTRIIYINIKCTDAQQAADIANAYAEAAKDFIEKNMKTSDPSIFSTATVPEYSISSGAFHYIMLGFVGGFALSVALITLLLIVDDRPRSPEDVAKYSGVPTLTVIPSTKKVKTSLREGIGR